MLINFIISVKAVLPMFILMAIGVLVRRSRLLSEDEIKNLNHMVFVVFFPLMMFNSIYGTNLEQAFNGKLMAFGVISVLCLYLVSFVFVMKVEKEPRRRGAMIQAIYRSNFVIMGIPIALNMFGKTNIAVTALMVAVIVPLYNVLAVFTLELFRGGKPNGLHILKQLVTNPLILGAVAGIIAVTTQIKLPEVLETVASDMANVATPMALIILGASINFRNIGEQKRNLIICLIGRLFVLPAMGLSAAALLGFRGIEFVTLIAIFAAPTAVSSFTMAVTMDSDGELAGNCVIFSSAFACITMFLWIFLFKNLGMF